MLTCHPVCTRVCVHCAVCAHEPDGRLTSSVFKFSSVYTTPDATPSYLMEYYFPHPTGNSNYYE